MKIQLKTDPKGEYREIQVNGGTTLEELYKSMKEQLPYTIMLARVDNTCSGKSVCGAAQAAKRASGQRKD